MKKLFLLCALAASVLAHAQSGDAFKGIWPATDPALMKSLNGQWQLKVVNGIADVSTGVPAVDDSWGTIPVPGCWETYGFSQPSYDHARPLTGYYRTTFHVPDAWRGQRIVLRFDGVLYSYDLWVNGHHAGAWESAYNTCLFDVTDLLTKQGPQELAMQVRTQGRSCDFDYNDDWAPCGIFRNVTLFAVPRTHLSDLTVTTRVNGELTVKAEVANATKHTSVECTVDNVEFATAPTSVSETSAVANSALYTINYKLNNPRLWTAETPYLYTLRVHVKEKGRTLQTVEQKVGFKELTIEGNVLLLNGQPIKLRGVNAHATDSRTVKVIGDTLTLRDMQMMKAASVNYMRLSHYPREPRFFELADSLGFYLIDEVPFGYGDKHLYDSTYIDDLKTRAAATIMRDKNHPSVLLWSVGNENPLTKICIDLGEYVAALDPSRPYCYPQVGSYFRRFWEKAPKNQTASPFPSKAPVYAPHYPTTGQIAGFYQRLDRPVVFTEYCHTLGISFEDHDRQWEIIERTPGIAGGSVWEWADQGITLPVKPRKDYFGFEERVFTSSDRAIHMQGNKGTDGLVCADRTPLPNYYELQRNYAQAFVGDDLGISREEYATKLRLPVVNRYDFLNLKDHITFSWALTSDCDTVLRGAFSPDCAPHDSVVYDLTLPSLQGLSILHVDIADATGHQLLRQSFVLNKPELTWTGHADVATLIQEGPLVRAGRKETLAERVKVHDQRLQPYLLRLADGVATAADTFHIAANVQTIAGTDGTRVDFTLTPDSLPNIFLSELGVAYLLARSIDRVQWIGQGPFASYPGRHRANRYGFWSLHKDDFYFEGNRMGVDACLLSDSLGNGLLVTGDGLNLNFEQTDRGIVLTVNAAVSGQGPKFGRTAFPVWAESVGAVSGSFRLFRIEAGQMAEQVKRLFPSATDVKPFRPFLTQYDTYLMRYGDVVR